MSGTFFGNQVALTLSAGASLLLGVGIANVWDGWLHPNRMPESHIKKRYSFFGHGEDSHPCTILRSKHPSWLDYLYWDIELEP